MKWNNICVIKDLKWKENKGLKGKKRKYVDFK